MTFITPLANPKGVKHQCELCGKPAYVQCSGCRVTYYCDQDHEKLDRLAIHQKICSLISVLRSGSLSGVEGGSEEEKAQKLESRKTQQLRLLDVARTEAHKKLFQGEFDLAIPAALQALRISMEIWGQDSLDLVPSYLLLGEASVGLKQYNQAEEYLSLAKWAIMKSKAFDAHEIQAQLHHNFGLLYAANKNYPRALEHVAQEIYSLSLLHGPNHVSVAGGYFQLANIFWSMQESAKATQIYDKLVSLWQGYLVEQEKQPEQAQKLKPSEAPSSTTESTITHQQAPPPQSQQNIHKSITNLNEAEQTEAIQMLQSVLETRSNAMTQSSSSSGGTGEQLRARLVEAYGTLKRLLVVFGEREKIEILMAKAITWKIEP